MRGVGEPQKQIGEDGFGVSGAPEAPPIRIGPIVMGKRHSQWTPEIGLTKCPVLTLAADHFIGGRSELCRLGKEIYCRRIRRTG